MNIFIGPNGQGKTNLIEALYFLINGKSFRTASLGALFFVKEKSVEYPGVISGSVRRGLLEDNVEAVIETGHRHFLLNKKKVSPAKIQSQFPSILFSPESLSSIKEGPEYRRDLVDEIVRNSLEFGPMPIVDYFRVLKSRNRLLKDGLAGKSKILEVLESLNPSFLRTATLLTRARIEAIAAIESDFQKIFSALSMDENVKISVDYVISDEIANGWSIQQIYNALNKRLNELHVMELKAGTSLVGPHKHDIRFLYNGNDSRFFCSQGQQRALILAFKIAQIVYHKRAHDVSPILFLDDVLSELDLGKREYLLKFIREHESQIFVTTTDFGQLGNFSLNDSEIFHVEKGNISRGLG